MIDTTGKFNMLASDYAKAFLTTEDNVGYVVIEGYEWRSEPHRDALVWFVRTDQESFTLYNETEDEEWE